MALSFLGGVVVIVLLILGAFWVYENVEIRRRPTIKEEDK